MKYEIVELPQMPFAGLTEVTSNSEPDMTQKIGRLWQKLGSVQAKFSCRTNQKAVGLYCDYGTPTEQDYTVLVGVQISNESALDAKEKGFAVKQIPNGKYAKFTVKGDVAKDVGKAWAAIWSIPLERTFTGDFEEYQEDCNGKTGTIFIYVAIK